MEIKHKSWSFEPKYNHMCSSHLPTILVFYSFSCLADVFVKKRSWLYWKRKAKYRLYQGITFRSYRERGATLPHIFKDIRTCSVAIIGGTSIRHLPRCYFYPFSRGKINALFPFMQMPNKGQPVSENIWRVIFVFSHFSVMTFFFFLNAVGKWWGRTCVTVKIALF